MLDINDWITVDSNGKEFINILDCVELYIHPKLYATFMLWLLSELYENLPEVGDSNKPKIVFFFDEAQLLFDNAPKELLEKIKQVVKLIRSKGVGIFFISQFPVDIPDSVLSQLNNKVQHSLHAYTPKEQKAVKAAAESFRANPAFNTQEAIGALGIGEALISTLDNEGVPTIVEKGIILPPKSLIGAITNNERNNIVTSDFLESKYRNPVDRLSAYELITKRVSQEKVQEELAEKQKRIEKEEKAYQRSQRSGHRGRPPQNPSEKMINSTVQSLSRELGRS